MTPREVQAALLSLGYSVAVDGVVGPRTRTAIQAFQRGRGLAADGVVGPQMIKALQAAMAEPGGLDTSQAGVGGTIPPGWLPSARLSRVIVHWTAGSHRASGLDRAHYHIVIEGDGTLSRGTPSIALNDAGGAKPGYAAHTLNCNTGSIGVALCCMAGAVESPFKPGNAPMTPIQWQALPRVVADLCRRYDIPVTPKTVLSHAEVQPNLCIKQKGKWDISRVPPVPSLVGAKACGDALRAAVASLI